MGADYYDMFCPGCGSSVSHDARFCSRCGGSLDGVAPQRSQPDTVLPVESDGQAWASNVLLGSQMSPAHPTNLVTEEAVVLRATTHWWKAYGYAIAIFGLACVLTVALQYAASDSNSVPHNAGPFMGALFTVVALLAAVFGAIERRATEYVVTNRRVSVKDGFVSRRSLELLLSKIEGVSVEQNPFSAALGFGRVVVHGIGGTREPLEFVEDPHGFRASFQAQIEAQGHESTAVVSTAS